MSNQRKVSVIRYTVGVDLLAGAGFGKANVYQSLLNYATRLQDDLRVHFPEARIEWVVDPRLGVTVKWTQVEVEGDELSESVSTVEYCRSISDQLWEMDERWFVSQK